MSERVNNAVLSRARVDEWVRFLAQPARGRAWLRALLISSGLLVCAFVVLIYPIKLPVNYYDEGLVVVNASRLLAGEVLYRDFWVAYSPGQYYVVAILLWLFGRTLMVARLYDTLVRLLIVVSAYAASRRLSNARFALVPAGLVLLLLALAMYFDYAIFPALLLMLWSLLAFQRYAEQRNVSWLWLAGATLGLTAIFRYDFAGYSAVGLASAILIEGWLWRRRPWRDIVQAECVLALGALALALPLMLYQGVVSGFEPMFHYVIMLPLTVELSVRQLPYPDLIGTLSQALSHGMLSWSVIRDVLRWLQFCLPIPLYGLVLLFGTRAPNQGSSPRSFTIVPAAVTGGLLFARALSRFDPIHLFPSVLFLAPCLAWGYQKSQSMLGGSRRIRLLAAGIALPVMLSLISSGIDSSAQLFAWPPWRCYSELPSAGCVAIPADQEGAVRYVQARTAPNEPIFVGNARHDLLVANDASFYFLAGRPSATFYTDFWPGVVTTRAVQAVIISELTKAKVIWAVTAAFRSSTEPNASSVSSGVHLLDDYLRTHYRLCASFGRYTIWQWQGASSYCR